MKKIFIGALGALLMVTSCHDLDLNPLSSGSTESWYSTVEEIEMAVNYLYSISYWPEDGSVTDWSDDWTTRNTLTDFETGSLSGQNSYVTSLWSNQYKVIARANAIIENANRAIENGESESDVNSLVAEAHFHRAAAYAKLIVKFGDVPLVLTSITTDEALTMGRTDASEVLEQIYSDFDDAADVLPTSYSSEIRATKGAALALKARVALIMEDWETAAEAAKEVMDLGVYSLHPDYGDLFLQNTKASDEFIFKIPRDITLTANGYIGTSTAQTYITRNPGGWGQYCPSWELLAAYTCTDGLPIDESPLFDPHEPFENRDPRLAETIVPFYSEHLGYEYTPHPEDLTCYCYNTDEYVTNNDTRANAQYASYNGLVWKKGIDDTWLENSMKISQDRIYCRYAEVLLTYAEAKIEMDDIDDSCLEAMNMVRARAYGVDVSDTDNYPAFTSTDQTTLRHQLRVERRMEMAKEGRRYTDIIRWRLAEKVIARKTYGIIYPASECIEKVVDEGDWFWAFAPDIDEDGCADFTALEEADKIMVLAERTWLDRQYLWPIPTTEIQINENMTQNDGY